VTSIRAGLGRVGLAAAAAAASAARRAPRGDQGAFAALELAILTPFVIVLMLLVVAFGRVERGRELVDQAAQAAARAGSLSTNAYTAQQAARNAATQTLSGGGLSCGSVSVDIDTSAFYPGGQVVAHVSCRASLEDVAVPGLPGAVMLTASSTSPLEQYRPYGGG
jgi:Flp pilus assembly protein TadG